MYLPFKFTEPYNLPDLALSDFYLFPKLKKPFLGPLTVRWSLQNAVADQEKNPYKSGIEALNSRGVAVLPLDILFSLRLFLAS